MQAPHDPFGLGLVVGRRGHADRIAVAAIAPELLVEELRIAGDQRVRRAQDAHRGAVILLELHHLQRREVLRQLRQIVERSAAPAVDRLVVVADDGERRAFADEQLDEPVLRRIGVLVLVDEQVAAALAPLRRRRLVRRQEPDRQRDQVVEIHGLVRAQRVVVAAVRLRGGPVVVAARGLRRGRGGHQRVLPGTDPPLCGTRAGAVGRPDQLGDDALDVAGIEDREAGLEAQRGGVTANDLEPERMERADRDVGGEVAVALPRQQLPGPLAHFARCPVRERDRDDPLRVVAAFDEMPDLRGDDARLAAAGARQHEQRAIEISHRLVLRGIERKRHRNETGRGAAGC